MRLTNQSIKSILISLVTYVNNQHNTIKFTEASKIYRNDLKADIIKDSVLWEV